jgi:hypothetical protein
MTQIRDYRPEDFERVTEIYQTKGYEFALPDLNTPTMILRKVVTDSDNRVRLCALGDLHLNVMLLVDPTWGTPEDRLRGVMELQAEGFAEAGRMGLSIAMTQMDGRFADRMKAMGWIEAPGRLFYRGIP